MEDQILRYVVEYLLASDLIEDEDEDESTCGGMVEWCGDNLGYK